MQPRRFRRGSFFYYWGFRPEQGLQIQAPFFCLACRRNTKCRFPLTRKNVKVEEGSTFTFPRDTPYISSILFTRVRTKKNYALMVIRPWQAWKWNPRHLHCGLFSSAPLESHPRKRRQRQWWMKKNLNKLWRRGLPGLRLRSCSGSSPFFCSLSVGASAGTWTLILDLSSVTSLKFLRLALTNSTKGLCEK